ncbi:MAG: hypothetical protein KGJ49_04395 [Alphaproteobacteria bacterium]|nr:hypothetical protein [Alphaproteobacteria bacterium]
MLSDPNGSFEQYKDATFENSVPRAVASNYRRLRKDKQIAKVLATLTRRGMHDVEIETLLRTVAGIQLEWQAENEPIKHAEHRRGKLAKKLRALAHEIAEDRDLGGLCYQINIVHWNAPPADREGMQTLAQLIDDAASSLEPYEGPIRRIGSGAIMRQSTNAQKTKPARDIQSFALRRTFALLEGYFKGKAPNIETETIVSVLLGKPVKPGTMTHLRRKERQQHFRD